MGKKDKSKRGEGSTIAPAAPGEKPDLSRWLNPAEDLTAWDNKHALYQRAVQRPRGDISYLLKFFLMYVGGRVPLCLREDFCGTALICAEWLKADARRTAIALDLDEEALRWGACQHLSAFQDRVALFHGNVLAPLQAARMIHVSLPEEEVPASGAVAGRLYKEDAEADHARFVGSSNLSSLPMEAAPKNSSESNLHPGRRADKLEEAELCHETGQLLNSSASMITSSSKDDALHNSPQTFTWHHVDSRAGWEQVAKGADITCAFNFSICCLHNRQDLLKYFCLVRKGLSLNGGVFALDLYGGTSSECALKLRRPFGDFTVSVAQPLHSPRLSACFSGSRPVKADSYVLPEESVQPGGQYTWEQEAFDTLTRMTRISIHFHLIKSKRVMRRAFTYQWRLWTLPEVRECLLEAGFKQVHFWMKDMPDLQGREDVEEQLDADVTTRYMEVEHFDQRDAWNAYVVGLT
eukprot:SM000163S02301  [mRNA]  locus=s163:34909:36904:- [translate_table: standard]